MPNILKMVENAASQDSSNNLMDGINKTDNKWPPLTWTKIYQWIKDKVKFTPPPPQINK